MTNQATKASLTRKHRKGQYDGSWYSQDGTIEVRPAYGPSLRGGSVTRPSYYCVIDGQGQGQRTASDLDRARWIVAGMLARRIKENGS
jgi:hypothetical protein